MRRVEKIASAIARELAPEISRSIDESFGIVTLMSVEVNPDLKDAIVSICCHDESRIKQVLKKLNDGAPAFQQILRERLKMKFTPRLKFVEEQGLDNVSRVEKILDKINKQKGE